MDLTILTCNYNTPDLIDNLIKSIMNTCSEVPDIVVADTGQISSLDPERDVVRHICLPNTSHGPAVDAAFRVITTKYVLLVDSDVLFLKDFKIPFERFCEGEYTLMGEVVGDRGGKSLYPRVNPWYCFINLENLKKHDISFYDHHRTKIKKSDKIYDIGSSFFEDVCAAGLCVADVMLEDKYFKHYEGMSWRVQKFNPGKGDTDIDVGGTHDNIALYEYGMMIRAQYEKDTINL